MLFLFTDYGLQGPYTGQVTTVLGVLCPSVRVINLMADAPAYNPKASAYLLNALSGSLPDDSIILAVVDPGVGGFDDKPVVLKVDTRWHVGPDNGLFDIVARTAAEFEAWEIVWRPEELSNSFHGRDLYAPVCAMIANKDELPVRRIDWIDRHSWPDNLQEIIYIDYFGNCMTGIRSDSIADSQTLTVAAHTVRYAQTFSAVQINQLFWYRNSAGLIEIAANRFHAGEMLGVGIGARVEVV